MNNHTVGMKIIVLFFTALLFSPLAFAQPKPQLMQTAYAEIEIDRKQGEKYKVLPLKEDGLLCFLEGEQHLSGGNKELQLRFYNKDLALIWEKNYIVDYQDVIVSEYRDGNMVYFLVGSKNDEYRVMRVGIDDGMMTIINLSPIKNFAITHFKVHKKQVLTAGKVNNHPLVMIQAYEEVMKPIVLPAISQLDAELIDVVIDSVHDNIYVLLERLKPITEQGIYINRYDWKATLIDNQEISFSNEYNMHSYLALPSRVPGEVMLLGSYGLGTDTGTQGIYSMLLADGKLKANRFYDFGYLNNFFNYLPEKRREKRIKKIKAKLKSDDKVRHRYKLFLHKLQLQNDRILLVAESYSASTDYRRMDMMNPNGYFWNPYRRIYSGTLWTPYNYLWRYSAQNRRREMMNQATEYEYQHAFALGFNTNGELLWDNSFTFQDDTKSSIPMEKSQVLINQDTAVMIQVDEEEVYYKASYQSDYQEKLDTMKIPMGGDGDEFYNGEYGGTQQWFDQHFISSGVRDLKNKVVRDRNRKVFFLARYSYLWHEEKKAKEEIKE